MTINTIIAHNWAILYSGDSTTKISDIEGKTRSQAQPAKKLSGLETAKRKKKRRVVLPQKNLDFLTFQKTQLKGSALIENGRRSKSWLILFWIMFCCCWCLQLGLLSILSWAGDALLSMQRQFLIQLKGSQNSFWNSWESTFFKASIMKNYLMCCCWANCASQDASPHTHCLTYFQRNLGKNWSWWTFNLNNTLFQMLLGADLSWIPHCHEVKNW